MEAASFSEERRKDTSASGALTQHTQLVSTELNQTSMAGTPKNNGF